MEVYVVGLCELKGKPKSWVGIWALEVDVESDVGEVILDVFARLISQIQNPR